MSIKLIWIDFPPLCYSQVAHDSGFAQRTRQSSTSAWRLSSPVQFGRWPTVAPFVFFTTFSAALRATVCSEAGWFSRLEPKLALLAAAVSVYRRITLGLMLVHCSMSCQGEPSKVPLTSRNNKEWTSLVYRFRKMFFFFFK